MKDSTAIIGASLRPALRTLALLCIAFTSVTAKAQEKGTIPPDLAALAAGLAEIPAVGSPGGVTVFGPRAWPLVVGGNVPVAAAALGTGTHPARLIALTQDGYLTPRALDSAETQAFLLAGIQWLAGGKKRPSLARLGRDADPFPKAIGLAHARSARSADVLLVTVDDLAPERLGGVRDFLAAGGGVLLAMTPWGWQQLHSGLSLARDCTMNRLMEPFGLAFDPRIASKTTPGGFRVIAPGDLADNLHADRAWRSLRSGTKLGTHDGHLALASLDAAIGALSDFEPSLMVPMRRLVAAQGEGTFTDHLTRSLADEAERRTLAPLDTRFGNWWLAGPFPAGPLGREGLAVGKPLKIERELERCGANGPGPALDRTWATRGAKLPWRRVELSGWGRALDVGQLDLHALAAADLPRKKSAGNWDEDASLLLVRTVELEEPRSLEVRVEASGGLRLVVDGREVASAFAAAGACHLDATLELKPGTHHIWIRSSHHEGGWQLRFSEQGALDAGLVNDSIERGVEHLLAEQYIDGSWSGDNGYGPGTTAMVLFALAKSGLPASHPAIRRGMAYLDAHAAEHVYSLCAVMLVRSLLDPTAEPFLREGVERLASWEESSGLWAYPVHPGGATLPEDLSNTLFAALALDAASGRGVEVSPDLWRALIHGTLACREKKRGPTTGVTPLGFSYRPRGDITGSMTVAGLTCLVLARERLGSDQTPHDAKRVERAIEEGLSWLDRHMDFKANPGQDNWHMFWIYGIERVGSLLHREELGGVDWYRTGAESLITRQGKGGGWNTGHPNVDTPLALLFLTRATAPVSGDASPRDWRLLSSEPISRGDQAEDAHTAPLELVLHVRRPETSADPLLAWIECIGDGPLPERLSWLATTPGGVTDLGSVTATEDKGRGRFTLRYVPPTGDEILLWARAELAAGKPLESNLVRVPPRYSEASLELAPVFGENLLLGAKASATSSSVSWHPSDAIDGDCTSNWVSADADEHPTWSADLPKAKRASRVLLIPYGPSPQYRGISEALRVRVTINRDQTLEADLDPDPLRPGRIDFGRTINVHRLDITLLARSGEGATGFSEILLLP